MYVVTNFEPKKEIHMRMAAKGYDAEDALGVQFHSFLTCDMA